jgi:hypothetical protein
MFACAQKDALGTKLDGSTAFGAFRCVNISKIAGQK